MVRTQKTTKIYSIHEIRENAEDADVISGLRGENKCTVIFSSGDF